MQSIAVEYEHVALMRKQNLNEWALCVGVADARLAVPVLLSDGQSDTVPLQALGERGLPTGGALCTRVVDSDLASWDTVPESEFLTGFGLGQVGEDAGAGEGHVVYAFAGGASRYLVPALALMRAFFRPTRFMLPDMFLAQALDHLCYPDALTEPHGLKVTAYWASSGRRERMTNAAATLAWLRSTPGTRALAASVHDNAMKGRLALALPHIVASVVPWGVEKGGTVYVTKLSLKSLRPADAPTPKGKELRRQQSFNLYGKGAASQSVAGLGQRLRLEPRADGQTSLVDDEWAQVEPLLRGRVKRRLADVSLRDITETVLAKAALGYGAKWQLVNRLGVQEPLLAYYYRKWATSGALEACVAKLNGIRTGQGSAEP